MCKEPSFCVNGTVAEIDRSGLIWVKLANGHRTLGHLKYAQRKLVDRIRIGADVTVKLSPSDLSHGQLILNESKL